MEVPMRVVVDFQLCESNALCTAAAPTVFELGDDDYLTVLDETPDEKLWDSVRDAAAACPKRAITLIED
jgi:ferredoxin